MVPTEFRLTAPPAADNVTVLVLFARLLGVLALARPSPSPELRSRAADPVSNFLSGSGEWTYIAEANRLKPGGRCIYFLVADATRVVLRSRFDAGLCLTNTWGTMSDKLAVLGEMRRLAPETGTRLITVYASTSVASCRQWYANLGHEVVEITDEHIRTSGGFVSGHFTEERLRSLIGDCAISAIGDVAYLAQA